MSPGSHVLLVQLELFFPLRGHVNEIHTLELNLQKRAVFSQLLLCVWAHLKCTSEKLSQIYQEIWVRSLPYNDT